jgi:ABC transporter substrate binding protein
MQRREFITLLGGAAAWPLAARAQQLDVVRRIGVLTGFAESDQEGQAFVAAFREGLQKLGWAEGRNIRIDYRWAALDTELMQRFAKELVALQPDLILTQSTPAAAAMLQQTRTIPIVFAIVADPIGSGFVASFPQPGGNVTGFVTMEPTMAGKWLELLKGDEIEDLGRSLLRCSDDRFGSWSCENALTAFRDLARWPCAVIASRFGDFSERRCC